MAYLLIAVKPLWSLVSFFGNLDFLVGYLTPIGDFLATGWGTLTLIGSGFLLLLYVVHRQQPSATEGATSESTPEPEPRPIESDSRQAQEVERLTAALKESEQENEKLERELADRGDAGKSWGATVMQEDSSTVIERLKADIERLKTENAWLSDSLEGRRRKRIEHWRSVIRSFDFSYIGTFGHTETYAEMKPYLRPEVIQMLEEPRTTHVGNPARGQHAHKYTLLDEVARIEREWDLI